MTSWKSAKYKDILRPDYLLEGISVGSHPLSTLTKPVKSLNNEFKADKEAEADATPVFWDPLSAFAGEASEVETTINETESSTMEPWSARKSSILSRFGSGVERLSLASSYLSGEMPSPTGTSSSRHEQLDTFDEGTVKELKNLSVQEYTTRILELRSALTAAWVRDEKVNALKIVIQCSKLLVDADSSVRFYPAKFVLITDIIEQFGDLVFERLKAKHEESPDAAAETARNWFYKIASIRELIPRFYVEASILASYMFLDPNGSAVQRSLIRLSKTITGIGDPLVASYARCYMARVGAKVAPHSREHLSELMFALLRTYGQLETSIVEERLKSEQMDLPTYYSLFSPALDFLLQCVTHNASEKQLNDLVNKCTATNSSLLLNSLLSSLKPQFVAERAMNFVTLIHETDTVTTPRCQLYRSLGLCLMVEDPHEGVRVKVLNLVWKNVSKFKNPSDYMSCAEVWVDYVCRHMDYTDINTFISVTIKQMNIDRAYERHQSQLYGMIERIAANVPDLGSLFNMNRLLPMLDLIQAEPYKTDACKSILEMFVKRQHDSTSDPLVISSLMHISKTMLSSVNALTLDDSRRTLAGLVCGFLSRVDYGADIDAQMSFFIDARGALGQLDDVLIHLIHSVNRLAVQIQRQVRGHHSRKSVAQAKGCLAFCIVSIPSVYNSTQRFKLYLESAGVALLNQCVTHADDCFLAAVDIIPNMPETSMFSCVTSLLGHLVYSPDDPREDPLSLIDKLLKYIAAYTFDPHSDTKPRIWLAVLKVLSRLANPWMEEVDIECNDSLYGGDQRYVDVVEGKASQVLSSIIDYLTTLKDAKLFKRQAILIVELMYTLASHGDLEDPANLNLIAKLWTLSRNSNCLPPASFVALKEFVARRSGEDSALLTKLN